MKIPLSAHTALAQMKTDSRETEIVIYQLIKGDGRIKSTVNAGYGKVRDLRKTQRAINESPVSGFSELEASGYIRFIVCLIFMQPG